MPSDPISILPEWLIVGVVVGILLGLLITGIFFAGARLFPNRDTSDPIASGASRKRAEIRHYLRTIGEAFVEDRSIDGQPVEFYLPDRDVAITFDARAYFRIDRTDTYAVLVEHEMPGIHLGARLPFETPEFDFDDGSETDEAITAAFAVLGLPADASEAEVRAAYRERIKQVHPDHGGDRKTFQQVQDAYTTARNHAAQTASATS